MSKCNGKRIRNISRLRRLTQLELMTNRGLHLRFWRSPVTGQDLLDLCRGIIMHRKIGLRGGETENPSSMAHQNRRLRTLVMGIELLDRETMRITRLDHLDHPLVEVHQSGWK